MNFHGGQPSENRTSFSDAYVLPNSSLLPREETNSDGYHPFNHHFSEFRTIDGDSSIADDRPWEISTKPPTSLTPGPNLSEIVTRDIAHINNDSIHSKQFGTGSTRSVGLSLDTHNIVIENQQKPSSFVQSRGTLENNFLDAWNYSNDRKTLINVDFNGSPINHSRTAARLLTSRTPGPPRTPEIMDGIISHVFSSSGSNSPNSYRKISAQNDHSVSMLQSTPSNNARSFVPSGNDTSVLFSPGQEEMVSRLIQGGDTPAANNQHVRRDNPVVDFIHQSNINIKPRAVFAMPTLNDNTSCNNSMGGIENDSIEQDGLFKPKSDLSYDAEPFDPYVRRNNNISFETFQHNSRRNSKDGNINHPLRDASPFSSFNSHNGGNNKLRSSFEAVRTSRTAGNNNNNANNSNNNSIQMSNNHSFVRGNFSTSTSSSFDGPHLFHNNINNNNNNIINNNLASSFERPPSFSQQHPAVKYPHNVMKTKAVGINHLTKSYDSSASSSTFNNSNNIANISTNNSNLVPPLLLSVTGDNMRSSTDSLKSMSTKASISSVQRIPVSTQAGAQDFVETPRTKQHYKQFQEYLRNHLKEFVSQSQSKSSSDHNNNADNNGTFNVDVVLQRVLEIPEHSRWRCYIDLAELAKKNNKHDLARNCYIAACCSERRAMSCWLEWSKMEEENGFLDKAYNILKVALISCSKLNESLLPRMIKLRERQFRHNRTREWLSMLKYESLEKTWKSILEGCLFEARVGNFDATRDMLKYLMRHVPWYGPLYLEAYRLEEREEKDDEALKIIGKGLVELPRYGPLWFGMMHIKERRDVQEERCQWQRGMTPVLRQTSTDCAAAVVFISRELMWRVYLEKYFVEERAMEIAARGLYNHQPYYDREPSAATANASGVSYRRERSLAQCRDTVSGPQCRVALCQSLLLCANNLRWKVLLIGARCELRLGNETAARHLLAQVYEEIPKKSLSSVVIECSRLEEYLGHVSRARKILRKACLESGADWRLFYEWMLLEARQGSSCLSRALLVAGVAVVQHANTGRIWALLLQLYHRWEAFRPYQLSNNNINSRHILNTSLFTAENTSDVSPRDIAVRRAIAEVPKSGEVWCEEGRARLNPLLPRDHFDLGLAQQALTFAMQFTPQFGDTLIEYLRLELLIRSCLKVVCRVLEIDFVHFANSFLMFDWESDLYMSVQQEKQQEKQQQQQKQYVSAAEEDDFLLKNTAIYKKITAPIVTVSSGVASHNNSHNNNKRSVTEKRRDIKEILQLQYNMDDDVRELESLHFPQLHRRCMNADPNYGMLWIHCRDLPDDIPLRILARAKRILLQELLMSYPLYLRATLLYVQRLLTQEVDAFQLAALSGTHSLQYRQYHDVLHCFLPLSEDATRVEWIVDEIRRLQHTCDTTDDNSYYYFNNNAFERRTEANHESDDFDESEFDRVSASQQSPYPDQKDADWQLKPLIHRVALTGQSFTLSDFSTGCVEINRSIFNPHRSEEQTWQYLFATDNIV